MVGRKGERGGAEKKNFRAKCLLVLDPASGIEISSEKDLDKTKPGLSLQPAFRKRRKFFTEGWNKRKAKIDGENRKKFGGLFNSPIFAARSIKREFIEAGFERGCRKILNKIWCIKIASYLCHPFEKNDSSYTGFDSEKSLKFLQIILADKIKALTFATRLKTEAHNSERCEG